MVDTSADHGDQIYLRSKQEEKVGRIDKHFQLFISLGCALFYPVFLVQSFALFKRLESFTKINKHRSKRNISMILLNYGSIDFDGFGIIRQNGNYADCVNCKLVFRGIGRFYVYNDTTFQKDKDLERSGETNLRIYLFLCSVIFLTNKKIHVVMGR